MALQEKEGKTILYTGHGSEWRTFGHPRKKRPLSSVVLDTGISQKLVNDVEEFMNSSQWYIDRGK